MLLSAGPVIRDYQLLTVAVSVDTHVSLKGTETSLTGVF